MKRALSILLVLLLIASLSAVPVLAAGGTGSGSGNGGGNGKSPLEVASVTINGSSLESVSSVPASGTINVSFTRGMDEHAASTITAIKIADAASKVSFDGDRTFSVTFSNLKPGKYTLVVGTAAQANNDNFLEKEYTQAFVVSGPDHDCPSAGFTDVNPSTSNWTHKPIDYVLNHKYMQGLSETSFDPNGVISRAMVVQVLYAMDGKPAPGASAGFGDVAAGRWFTNAVNWAANNQIVSGYSKTSFRPEEPVSRQQLVTIVYRYAQYKRYDSTASGIIADFEDAASLSDYAVIPMKWAIGHKIISGLRTEGHVQLAPKGTATRAQLAVILKAFDENIKTS